MSRLETYRQSVLNLGFEALKELVLQAAFEMDLFERIGTESKTARTLAEELGADPVSLELFLNALVGLGLLAADGAAYRHTKFGSEILLKAKPSYVGDAVRHHSDLIKSWSRLKDAVLSGKPLDRPVLSEEEERQRVGIFIRAMHNNAVSHAALLAKKLSLDRAKTLLDLGGGSGAFSIEFLKANPDLRATIFDLPATLEVTRQFVEAAGLTERVEFQAGDFHENEIQGSFNVCFLSHIIHSNDAQKNKQLIKKIFDHLHFNGRLIVQDFFLNADCQSPQFASLFALNMLLHTDGGRTYTFDEADEWMREAGFLNIERPVLKLPRSTGLLIGEKK